MALISGVVALVIAVALWAYLRARVRSLRVGIERQREFSEIVREVSERDLPDRIRRRLSTLVDYVGTGSVASRIFRQLAEGNLGSLPTREKIVADREQWAEIPSATRIMYARAVFAGLLADSYYMGVFSGTLFRRAAFFLNATPADMAHSVDALETKILITGTERVVERAVERDRNRQRDDCDDGMVRA